MFATTGEVIAHQRLWNFNPSNTIVFPSLAQVRAEFLKCSGELAKEIEESSDASRV
jgi:hypothetical protein